MKYVPAFTQAIELMKSNEHHLCKKVLLGYDFIFIL